MNRKNSSPRDWNDKTEPKRHSIAEHLGKSWIHKVRQKQREKEKMEVQSHQKANKMAEVSPDISIITLDANWVSSLVKWHRVSG